MNTNVASHEYAPTVPYSGTKSIVANGKNIKNMIMLNGENTDLINKECTMVVRLTGKCRNPASSNAGGFCKKNLYMNSSTKRFKIFALINFSGSSLPKTALMTGFMFTARPIRYKNIRRTNSPTKKAPTRFLVRDTDLTALSNCNFKNVKNMINQLTTI